jgi:ABC-2 type transport system ATP-binding protein/ribosome-dependent ATPase
LWDTIHGTADAGAGVLVSTHYMEEAEECDRVVMLASGREVASGPVRDIVGDLRSVSVGPGVVPATLDLLRAGGAYVLADGRRWRVVGSDLGTVRAAVEPGIEVEEVPATFEEAFVSLAT